MLRRIVDLQPLGQAPCFGGGGVDHVIAHVGVLVVGRQAHQGRVARAGGDDGVVVEVERSLAVAGEIAGVSTRTNCGGALQPVQRKISSNRMRRYRSNVELVSFAERDMFKPHEGLLWKKLLARKR